jgi:hydroxymethylglutaryl-CoA lyase
MQKIKITEVGPRDGLQNEKTIVPTNQKIKFIHKLQLAGLENIETTSFVRPDRIPALSDSLELSNILNPSTNPNYLCLVPNQKGLENALKAGYKKIAVFGAASETFSQKNINMSIDDSIISFGDVIRKAKKNNIQVRGYISTAFYCPYEGKINPEKVFEIANKLLELGVDEIDLGDTIGKAVPKDVEILLNVFYKSYNPNLLTMHFHNTYGTALANVQKSLEMGITSFDSSAGGLGGCPYAAGASGNLATEDLVFLLENSGYDTGVQLDKLVEASRFMETILQKELNSNVYRALKK